MRRQRRDRQRAGAQVPQLPVPEGIPIGKVTSVGQTDTDLFQQVQIDPYVDFGALDAVLVLVPTERPRWSATSG